MSVQDHSDANGIDSRLYKQAIVTVFYSTYSGNSKALLQQIHGSNIMEQVSIKFINIDNFTMRNIVQKKFSVVPTIVVLIGDDLSLYSGSNAFEWVNVFSSYLEVESTSQSSGLLAPPNTPTTPPHADTKSSKSIVELAKEIKMEREKV